YERSHKGVKASANSDIIFFFTSAQDGNKLLDDERLSLADDLKKAHDQNQNKSKIIKQDKAQQVARDEKLVPTEYRVKIEKSNLRMDPTLTQKEETYQVILDIIKNTPCYNAFLITADVPILDIFPRVQNQKFIMPPSNDSLIDFLLDLSYKGPLKHISEILVDIDDIQNSEAYKMFIGISTGLIPPKIERGKGAQGTKAVVTPKKAIVASKKKRPKKKVSIRDESSDEESEEEEERLIRRKPRGVDIQDNLQVPKKKSTNQSQKLKGVGLRPEVLDEPTKKSANSDEGTGTSPEVPDEKIEDIPWVSTNDDETEDDDEEDDASINIDKTNDERTDTDVEDQVKGVAEMNIAKEAEEENAKKLKEQKADEEHQRDDQARINK
ncbi:hypothetical protein Tco_1411815, partial [Tanacetum coccineum]